MLFVPGYDILDNTFLYRLGIWQSSKRGHDQQLNMLSYIVRCKQHSDIIYINSLVVPSLIVQHQFDRRAQLETLSLPFDI